MIHVGFDDPPQLAKDAKSDDEATPHYRRVRDEIIAHTFERYGVQHTAMVSSHLFLQPRSAFREAGKVHGLSNEQISDLLTTLARSVDELLLPSPRDKVTRRRGDKVKKHGSYRFTLSPCRQVTLSSFTYRVP